MHRINSSKMSALPLPLSMGSLPPASPSQPFPYSPGSAQNWRRPSQQSKPPSN